MTITTGSATWRLARADGDEDGKAHKLTTQRLARDPGTATWHTYRPNGTEIHIRATAGLRAPP